MKNDAVTKDFIRDTRIFSDVFNQFVYGGRQVILPEHLEERDPAEIALPYGEDRAAVPIQKFRDVRKLYAAMTDGKISYILYGIESQILVHYAMPVRNGLYDMLSYAGQVEEAAKSHRRAMKERKEKGETKDTKEWKRPDPGEFLGGFWKEDRLIPCLTLTLYFGAGKWDGPLSLSEMMEVSDPGVLPYLNDYRMHLVAPGMMTDEEIMKYRTDLREVMLFIKYSRDKEKLMKVLETDKERFQKMEKRAMDVIEAVTNAGLKYEEEEAMGDMCKAIRDLRDEEYRLGEQEG